NWWEASAGDCNFVSRRSRPRFAHRFAATMPHRTMSAAAVLQGSLDSFKLPEVLTFLNTTRRRGTLTATCGDGREAYVFFDNGALVYAGSNQEQFRLSAILLRKKRITREQHEEIDELMTREGGRFGQIAIQRGVLTESQLRDFLKVQVSEILYDSFVWSGGTF